ncbi:MAG TPA: hypothetical protein VF721_13340 [Pyrinomonadaceae bacterium]|jgi:hypothetical protein
MPFDIQNELTELGQTIEITGDVGDEGTVSEQINFEPGSLNSNDEFILIASVIGNEENVDPKNLSVKLLDPSEQTVYELEAGNKEFGAEELFYINENPIPGVWRIQVESEGIAAFSVNVGFINVGFISKIRDYMPGRCDVCKISVKALAIAIFIALAKGAAPAWLIAKLGIYLKLIPELVLEFINSLIGFPIEKIIEKLCEKMRLCP